MYAAFPDEMDEPDALKIGLEVTAKNQGAAEVLQTPLHESFWIRLLGDGMSNESILRRLFGEQLQGDPFPEADSIVWIVKPLSKTQNTVTTEVISSCHWLDALKGVENFESSATNDPMED